jgi:hypothetical protein
VLLSNYSVINRNQLRDLGTAFTNPLAQYKAGLFGTWYTSEAVVIGETDKGAMPNGYNTESAYYLAPKAGGMASRPLASGALSGVGARGVNGAAALTGAGSLSGVGQLIISMTAALSGSGTISGAALRAFLQLSAALSGSGGLAAQAKALGALSSALSGVGAASATIKALGALAASITVTGDLLSTSNVADAILDSTDGVESGLTVRQALRLIAAAVAGKLSGAAGTTITIRSAVVDGHNRLVATVDSSGNRSAITYDLDD